MGSADARGAWAVGDAGDGTGRGGTGASSPPGQLRGTPANLKGLKAAPLQSPRIYHKPLSTLGSVTGYGTKAGLHGSNSHEINPFNCN